MTPAAGPRGESELYRIGNDVGIIMGKVTVLVESLQGPNGLAASFHAHVEKTDERFTNVHKTFALHSDRITRLEDTSSGITRKKAKRWAVLLLIYGSVITWTMQILVWLVKHHWPN